MHSLAPLPTFRGLDQLFVADILHGSADDCAHLSAWLEENSRFGEGLVPTLERKGLLAQAARRMVEASLVGNIALPTPKLLLTPNGLEWYEQCCASVAKSSDDGRFATQQFAKIPGLFIATDAAGSVTDLYTEEPRSTTVGQTVGSFRILELLGLTERRSVYRAESLFGGGRMAVKIIPTDAQHDWTLGERFLNGALVASCLGLPGCHPVHLGSRDFGCAFLVMPFVDGGSVHDRHAKEALTPVEAAQYCGQAARTLAAIHQAGYAHGNIKLGNILLGPQGVMLTDFALPDEALSPNSVVTNQLQYEDLLALIGVYSDLLGPELFPWEKGWSKEGNVPKACRELVDRRFSNASELGDAFDELVHTLGDRQTFSVAAHFLETSHEIEPTLPTPKVGDTLGKCVLTARIGEGSTGLVFRAQHQTLGIEVAIKVLSAVNHSHQELATQFQAEARMLARLNHPNIVRIWDFENRADCVPYLVLEFIEGQNLAELLKVRGSLNVAETIHLFTQVVTALRAAHQQCNLIHRDIKPANVLIGRDGVVKVADLGLASILENEKDLGTKIAGTPAYMPPEQSDGIKWTDHRSDIYSLGVTMYETLTGRVPFVGKSRTELMFRHATEKPIAPHQLNNAIPVPLSNLVMKMLEKKPDDRVQTYDALFTGLTESNVAPTPVPPPTKDLTPSRLTSIKRLFSRPKSSR